MRTLHRKLLRELIQWRGLLLLISSIIAAGITCFVALQSSYFNLAEAQRRYYRQTRIADFWIDLKKLPRSDAYQLLDVPGISEVRPRIFFQTTVDLEDTEEPVSGLVLSLPDEMPSAHSGVINGVLLRQGGYFTGRRRQEVLVNESFARTHRLFPGQRIHLILNNRRQELLIVGTVISSEFAYLVTPGSLVPDPKHLGVFYISRSFAEEAFDMQGAANQIVGRLVPGSGQRVDEILRRAETRLASAGVLATTPLERQLSNQFLSSEIEGLGGLAKVLPAIFLAVAATVLNILVTRMARRQRTVIGTLKALGYGDGQIVAHFLLFALSVGLLGGLLGSGMGYLAASGMTVLYRQFFEFPALPSRFYVGTHLTAILISLLCSMAGGAHAARQMLRLHAAEAMRPEPPRQGAPSRLESAVARLWSRCGTRWKMALRNLVRHRLRTATAVFASAMGAALLTTGFLMTESQDYLLEFQFYRETRSDLDLVFQDAQGRQALDTLLRLPGVDHVEPQLGVAGTLSHGAYQRKVGLLGLLPNARLTVPHTSRGEPLVIPASGLVLTRRLAELLHAEAGDRLRFEPSQGQRRPVSMPVAQVADSYMGLAAYADIDYLSKLVSEEFAMTSAQMQVDTRPDSLRQLYRELNRVPGIQSIQSQRDMMANIEKTLLQNQFVFIGLLVLFAGVIFLGSIVNAALVSLAERQREVATLAAMGYGRWQIGSMLLRESMTTTALGSLLGLPLGYALSWLAIRAYNNDLLRLPLVADEWVWTTTLSLAAGFALLAHAVVQWKLNRMDLLELLKVSE